MHSLAPEAENGSRYAIKDALTLAKDELSIRPEVLYTRDNFREWSLFSFGVYDRERHALEQLENLCQIGSIVEYKAVHDVLVAQTTLPMQLRIMWWERGLKDEMCAMRLVDPFTHKEYTDIGRHNLLLVLATFISSLLLLLQLQLTLLPTQMQVMPHLLTMVVMISLIMNCLSTNALVSLAIGMSTAGAAIVATLW